MDCNFILYRIYGGIKLSLIPCSGISYTHSHGLHIVMVTRVGALSTYYTLRFLRYSPGKNIKDQGHYSKVKGQIMITPRSCTPKPLTDVLIKFLLPTPYGFRDIALKIFRGQGHYCKVKGQSKSHNDIAQLQHPTNAPTKFELLTLYGF